MRSVLSGAALLAQDDSVGLVMVPGDRFGAGGGDRLQQEVAELGESGGFLAGDAVLREQAKDLAESAAHAGGGGEVVRGGIEFREGEVSGGEGASRGAEQMGLPIRVVR